MTNEEPHMGPLTSFDCPQRRSQACAFPSSPARSTSPHFLRRCVNLKLRAHGLEFQVTTPVAPFWGGFSFLVFFFLFGLSLFFWWFSCRLSSLEHMSPRHMHECRLKLATRSIF